MYVWALGVAVWLRSSCSFRALALDCCGVCCVGGRYLIATNPAPTIHRYYKPLQIALAVKEKNGGKLNSHLWFFSAFVKQLQPDYCMVGAPSQRLLAPCVRMGCRCCATPTHGATHSHEHALTQHA